MSQSIKQIFINGRFTLAPLTGVQRHAWAIVSRFKNGTLVKPARSFQGAAGHGWEQTLLPAMSRNGVLWSPCNVGPVLHRNHAVTIHDVAPFDVPEAFTPVFRNWYRTLFQMISKSSRKIFTVSEFSKGRIVEMLGVSPDKILLSGNGVAEEFYPRGASEVGAMKQAAGIEGPYLVCLGSNDPRKNFELVASAAQAFEGKDAPKFVFVGGSAHRVFQKVTASAGGNNVRFLGYINEELLPALYSGASAFIFPSRYEGFGLPVLEAMACGAPVISSRIPPVEEFAHGCVEFFPSGSRDALIAAIEKVVSDTAYAGELRTKGLARAATMRWDGPVKVVRDTLLALTQQ